MHGLLGSFLIALRNVLRQRRRTAFVAGAIAFGVAALILAGAFIEWIFWAAREGAIQNGLGHIHAARQGYFSDGTADRERFRLPEDSAVLQQLRADGRIRTVAPRSSLSGLVSAGETTLSFLGEGVRPIDEARFGRANIIVEGQALDELRPREIIVGFGLAANLGATVGDPLVLLVSLPEGGINAVEARVRGIFATESKAYDDVAIRIPLALANELTRTHGAHKWVVVLEDTAATTRVLNDLRERFGAHGLEFKPWYEMADFYLKTRDLLSRQMDVMFAIIGVIIVLSISNSMMMSVMERTSEIGTAMALGIRRAGVLTQFLGEGALLGVAGGLSGVAMGATLAALISWVGIPMPPPPGQARGFTAEMIVTLPLVLQAFGLAVGTALAAAAYPAWKASRIAIVDALRAGR